MPTSSIPAGSSGGLSPKYVKYTSSGTFTLPDGYGAAKPLLVSIQVLGGGGGGGLIIGGTGTVYIGYPAYFGFTATINYSTLFTGADGTGAAGGSGGLCATQLYLTSNLSFTIGAAGSNGRTTINHTSSHAPSGTGGSRADTNTGTSTGGTGGTTTASVLQATGGTGGSKGGYISFYNSTTNNGGAQITHGSGGTPAGTAGMATPLLGTLGGGSNTTTPIRGSFGVGGISTDNATATGAEGTGGGSGSIGAPGAVILTYWS